MRTKQSWPTTLTAPETPTAGLKVVCGGWPGTISKVCDGALTGMAEVRLESGTVCVSWAEIVKFWEYRDPLAVQLNG